MGEGIVESTLVFMEIGSFLELDIQKTGEYFAENEDVARLNSARAGIYHALKIMKLDLIYIPYYQCPTVNEFLSHKGINIKKYFLNKAFEPQITDQEPKSAVLIVNYFGIFSNAYIQNLRARFERVIIDNGPAFYNPPIDDCYNVYSARKFFGVPDGCYVVGPGANSMTNNYLQDYSSSTALFLLKRHEIGCSGSYFERMKNEERIDGSDILKMSLLTETLLGGINYQRIMSARRENFRYVHNQCKEMNLLDFSKYYDDSCVPMFYPLVVENELLVDELTKRQIYTGRRWNSVLKEVKNDTIEGWLSHYMVPVPIDQRYGPSELDRVIGVIKEVLNKGMA